VVPNGFREQGAHAHRRRHVLAPGRPIGIISVSNLVAGKGVDVNLAALGRLNSQGLSEWHYHVVGDGPLRSALEAQARDDGIADKVSFHGRWAHDDVYRLLGTCDVFSLPSAPEAFGIAYLEAMACGLLAIGVAGQGPAAFIEHERSGLLLGDPSASELASTLRAILERPTDFAPLAAAGRDRVWREFTWDAHARALTRVFEEAQQAMAQSRRKAARAPA
jgi:teichuronic acid biosynthesis glycosyltransferase TuaC